MKNMKKSIVMALCLTMIMSVPSFASEISVLVNGTALTFDQPPVNQDGRILVPLRVIFEAIGADIDWKDDTQTVTGVRDGVTVIMQIGNNVFTRNNEQITLDVPPQIIGNRTLVPVRAIAESFGLDVGWEQATQTVTIASVDSDEIVEEIAEEVEEEFAEPLHFLTVLEIVDSSFNIKSEVGVEPDWRLVAKLTRDGSEAILILSSGDSATTAPGTLIYNQNTAQITVIIKDGRAFIYEQELVDVLKEVGFLD